jgi:hypothetical protein
MEPKASPEEVVDSLADELSGLDSESALAVVSRWLAANKLEGAAAALATEVEAEPSKWGSNAPLIATTPSASLQGAPSSPELAPVGEALPVPGTSTRPGRLFDAEPIDPASVGEALLTKPDPVFFGERDDKRREQSATEEFPLTVRSAAPSPPPFACFLVSCRRVGTTCHAPPFMHACPVAAAQVHFDALTSGLESETHFRVEEKQIIAGRYVVIQYLGSGAPPAADPSYTPPPTQTASPAAVLASCIPAPPSSGPRSDSCVECLGRLLWGVAGCSSSRGAAQAPSATRCSVRTSKGVGPIGSSASRCRRTQRTSSTRT